MAALGLHVDRDGDIPVGTQLAWQIQTLITEGRLQSGEQLPSVRRLADAAGVNVNTIRSVYERLEGEGFIRTEHGRGSFVAENVPQVDPRAARFYATASDRGGLRREIGELEARLAAHDSADADRAQARASEPGRRGDRGPRVLSTEELLEIRDALQGRLEQIDAMRDDLVEVLGSIRAAIGEELSASPARTASAAGARRATRRRLSPAPKPSGSP